MSSRAPAITAVLFDLDRTLIDLERATRLGIAAHLAALGRPVGPETYPEWKRLETKHVGRYLATTATVEGQRRDRVREMTGEPYPDAEADAWFTAYRAHMEAELRLFDDTLPMLDQLEAMYGVPVGIVTNMETEYQLKKMAVVGLPVERFACFLGLDRLPAPKPHAGAFHHACAVLGIEPGPGVIFVGDEPHIDAYGAHLAGLRGVWLDRPGGLQPPVATAPPAHVERITGLAELPALLGRSAPAPEPAPASTPAATPAGAPTADCAAVVAP